MFLLMYYVICLTSGLHVLAHSFTLETSAWHRVRQLLAF